MRALTILLAILAIPPASAFAEEPELEQIVTCNAGAFQLLRSKHERRVLEMRIFDENIAGYFSRTAAFSRESGDLNQVMQARGYLSVRFGLIWGAFRGEDFSRAQAVVGGEYDDVLITVTREAGGIKFESHYIRPGTLMCNQWMPVGDGSVVCQRYDGQIPGIGPDFQERTNWFFRDCDNQSN